MMDKEKVDEKNAILEIADNDLADATGGGGLIKEVVQIINEVTEKTPVSPNPTLVSVGLHHVSPLPPVIGPRI